MDTVQTRAARMGDARALAVLHVETWRAAYRGLLPEALLASLDVDSREQNWRQILSEGDAVMVAERGSHLLGFSSYGTSRDDDASPGVGELFAIYVSPAAWGTGVGRQLHDLAAEALTSSGCTEATLWVLDGNERARRFYERCDWRHDGRVKTDEMVGATLTEVRYRRSLPLNGEMVSPVVTDLM